jgi:hypothetical protein
MLEEILLTIWRLIVIAAICFGIYKSFPASDKLVDQIQRVPRCKESKHLGTTI